MAIPVLMPDLGNEISEAQVDGWLKKPGDAVKAGEALLTITTPKLTMEIEAPAAGRLAAIHVEADAIAAVGAVLGMIESA